MQDLLNLRTNLRKKHSEARNALILMKLNKVHRGEQLLQLGKITGISNTLQSIEDEITRRQEESKQCQ